MERRQFVQVVTASAVTSLAGCAGSGLGESSLEVSDVDAHNTSFGNVIVRAMVVNNSSDSLSGTLYGEVDVQGGDTYTRTRPVTLAPNDSSSYKLEFDINISESLSGGSYEYSAWVEQ